MIETELELYVDLTILKIRLLLQMDRCYHYGLGFTIRGHGNISFATIETSMVISIVAKKGDCPDDIRENLFSKISLFYCYCG